MSQTDSRPNPLVDVTDLEVTLVEHPLAGAIAFCIDGPPAVSLVVWDADSEMHEVGEVWGVFVDGRAARASDGLTVQIEALVFAARAHYSRALHVLPSQRGLSVVESGFLQDAGLAAAA